MTPAALLLFAALAAAQPPAAATKHHDYAARTAASATVDVRPRVAGELVRLHVKEGEAVTKGQLLAEIDPRPYQLELDAAKARLLAAEARLRLAEVELKRLELVDRAGVVSREEVERARVVAVAGRADVAAAEAGAKVAALTLSYTRLASPIDGVAGRHLVTEGNLILGADARPILTVVGLDPLDVWFEVPERDIAVLGTAAKRPEVKVGFAGDDGFPHAAALDFVEPVVSPATNTVRARARLANPKGAVVPGTTARVRLTPAGGR